MLETTASEKLCSLTELENTTRSLLSGGRRANVLILECDPEVRRLWKTVLERDGHSVTAPDSADAQRAAIRQARFTPYDLVAFETKSLPERNGYGSLRQLCTPHGHLLITEGAPGDLHSWNPHKVRLWPKPFPINSLRWLASHAACNRPTNPLVAIICDDCPHTRGLLASTANSAGFEAICTDDGSQVSTLAAAFEASVVFLDILMPEQDGLTTMNQIRTAHLPVKVVAMSGGPDLYLQVARQLGATHTLSKPFQLETVRRLLADIAAQPVCPITAISEVQENT